MVVPACLRRRLTAAAVVAGLGLAAATSAIAAEPVDVELILAVDVSLSMSPMELEIQRKGYAAALTHARVLQAIREGVYGKIAVTYVEWAGQTSQHVVVPWTVIASAADAQAFVDKLSANPPNSARRTSISSACSLPAICLPRAAFAALKRVVDVSGDGANNQGPSVAEIRDEIVAQGITINGLPLMTQGTMPSVFDIDDLDLYYTNCVIGGPAAFMIPVNDWSQFPEAVRRKLVLELAAVPPESTHAPVDPDRRRPGLRLPEGREDVARPQLDVGHAVSGACFCLSPCREKARVPPFRPPATACGRRAPAAVSGRRVRGSISRNARPTRSRRRPPPRPPASTTGSANAWRGRA